MLETPVYLDIQATTPVDARVLDAMLPYFTEYFGNAASTHALGRKAAEAVLKARMSIVKSLGAKGPRDVIFTSGATEADNLAVKGVARALSHKGRHIVTAKTEHKAVLDSCKRLEKEGFQITYLRVGCDGLIDPDDLRVAFTPQTILVSIMAVNNEIGVVQDVARMGAICREAGILFHTDATQAAGKIPFNVDEMNVDLASLTAHKMYGPKGIGVLYARRSNKDLQLLPDMDGGGHEGGFRSGTLNVPGIVGMAKALEISCEELSDEGPRLAGLRDSLKEGLRSKLAGVHVNGHESRRLPGNLNLSFEGAPGDHILMSLPDIALSGGSACTSVADGPSHVLTAIGSKPAREHGAIRVGFGRFTTAEQVVFAEERLEEVVAKLRSARA